MLAARTRVGRWLDDWVHLDVGLAAASIAALAIGFAFSLAGTFAIESGGGPDARGLSDGERTEKASEPAACALCATFHERFSVEPSASFTERFASAFGSLGQTARKVATVEEEPDGATVSQEPDAGEPPSSEPEASHPAPPPVEGPKRATGRDRRPNAAEASLNLRLPLDSDSRTAIYDISARTVYLPNGQRLEAHSGLGSRLDDPRFIRTKMQGPTPPNVYNLVLRERLFHGVRAIRLLPVDDGKMFGRDGILAHSYMLGPNGQSNGCVSFRNYPAFLNAFLKGEVNRLVVVESLATRIGSKSASQSASARGG